MERDDLIEINNDYALFKQGLGKILRRVSIHGTDAAEKRARVAIESQVFILLEKMSKQRKVV